MTAATELVGWVPEDGDRGTWTIIVSCLFTVVICTWTAIHPRVHTTRRLRRVHKFFQLVKSLLAPELVCLESLQELIQARKTVRRCAKATNGELKLIHAFYLGMMGVRYRDCSTDAANGTTDTDNSVPLPPGSARGARENDRTGQHRQLPRNASKFAKGTGDYRVLWPGQYAFLLNNGLVSWADRTAWGLARSDIEDKSKADGFVKLTALCQTAWFVLQAVTRATHGLALAPLEVMTLAYIFSAVLTYALWWEKPKDIATAALVADPGILPQMSRAQRAAFDALAMEHTYDVVNDVDPVERQGWNIAWYVVARDCRNDEIPVMAEQEGEDVAQSTQSTVAKSDVSIEAQPAGPEAEKAKVVTEWDSSLYMTRYWPLLCLLGASFGALHLISWNAVFPTEVELWLWRGSALASIVTAVLCMQFKTISLHWEGPVTILKVSMPLLYIISRIIMAGETFAGLRAMEASTYKTYEIWNSWLHFL